MSDVYDWLYMVFYIFTITAGAFLSIFIHSLIDQSFLPLEAKIKVPMITSGYSIGTVLGGLLLLMSFWVSTIGLLVIWVLVLSAQIILIMIKQKIIDWELGHVDDVEDGLVKPEEITNRRSLIFMPVFIVFIVIGFCAGFCELLVGYLFAEIAQSNFSDEASLTAFLGTANSLFYVIITLINIFVLSKTLKKWGMLPGFYLHAFVHSLSFLLCFIMPSLMNGVLLRGSNKVTRFTFYNASSTLLCSFLPKNIQSRVRSNFNGIVFPIGFSMASVFLMFYQDSLDVSMIALVGLLMTIPWVLSLLGLKHYLFNYLKNNLGSKEESTVINAVQGIASLGAMKGADKVLRDYLISCDKVNLRKNVVISLSRYQTDAVINTLVSEFDHKQEKMQLATLESLSGFSDHRVTFALLQFLKQGQFSTFNVRVHLIFVLTKLIGKSIAPYLMEFLDDDDPRIRANTVEALGQLKDKKLKKILKVYLKDPNNRLRANAIVALFYFREFKKPALADLSEMLISSSSDMICSGLYAAGEIKAKKFIPILLEKIKDTDINVEINAAIALVKMKDPHGLEAIIDYLKSGDNELTTRIIETLPRIPEKIRYQILMVVSHNIDDEQIKMIFEIMKKSVFDFEYEKSFLRNILKQHQVSV
ncbi:MAG: hypothetical protein HON94_12435 [Methylococcales bacterium]|nr:hypothetical protein [Methylococcales bacterium]